MAISYPLQIPTVGITSISWTNSVASVISRSPFTFQGQSQTYPGQIRYAQISVENKNRDDAEEWVGFLNALNGCGGTFLMGDPLGVIPRRGSTTGVTVRGSNQSGSTLLVNTGQNSEVRWASRGDWLQLGTGSSSRLYKVTMPANTDSNGYASLEIWPSLRMTPVNGQSVIMNNSKGLFRLSSGTFDYSEQDGCKYSLSFSCEEVI